MADEYHDLFERGLYTEVEWAAFEARVDELARLGNPQQREEAFERSKDNVLTKEGLDKWCATETAQAAMKQNPAVVHAINRIYSLFERSTMPITLGEAMGRYLAEPPLIGVKVNWAPFMRGLREGIRKQKSPESFQACRGDSAANNADPALPAGVPATMTFSVPVSELSDGDLERVLDSIRRALQLALTERPTTEEAPEMAILLPPQRRFLLHCQESAFSRDVERYRRWAIGRTFRSIALEEQYEMKGKTFELDPGAPIGVEVPGEEFVRESVARIYEAIWLESFPGRRRRIDASAIGISKYSCPEHSESDDCEKTGCEYMKEWGRHLELTLPLDRSGSQPENPPPTFFRRFP